MKSKVTWNTWRGLFLASVKNAAEKCGADVSGLEIHTVALERTWGDKIGLVFTGASDETLERVCTYFQAWQAKHMGHLFSYGCQRVPHFGAPIKVYELKKTYACIAQVWNKGELPAGVKVGDRYESTTIDWELTPPDLEAWKHAKAESNRTGLAIAHCYYPCAD